MEHGKSTMMRKEKGKSSNLTRKVKRDAAR